MGPLGVSAHKSPRLCRGIITGLPQKPYYVIPDEPPAFVLQHNDYDAQQ